jgi:branched-chain amino acid transport system ATP-binding protein
MLIEAVGLSKYFGGLAALKDVNIKVRSEELLGIIGPNGAGKTTLFNVLTGFMKPTRGQVIYSGEDITPLSPDRIAHLGVYRTFQRVSVFRDLTVTENLVVGAHVQIRTGLWDDLFYTARCRKYEREAWEKTKDIERFLGLEKLSAQRAGTLSYGNQKLLSLGVALMGKPRILLLDEPAAGMNSSETNHLMSLVRKLKADNLTIIVVEHDMKFIMDLCERIVVLHFGSVIAEGTPKEVSQNEDVIRVYLGTKERRSAGN